MKTPFPTIWTLWSLLALAIILILPSGVEAWFNGLPWSGGLETIALAGLLFPYFWVKVVAYPPRFSIHLLPIASLSLTIFLFYFLRPTLTKWISIKEG